MSAYTKRLLLAATISILGVVLSYALFGQRPHEKSAEGKQLAELLSAKNEVQRRPSKRWIWERIGDQEPLFSGEAVRTGPDAEAKIVFKSGAEVDLDPESIIVIEESGDKLALDFIKGNLVVKGNASGGELALKSGTTSIDVNKADIALGKTAGKNIDVQVLRGSAQVNAGNKVVTLDNGKGGSIGEGGLDESMNFLKIKSPAPNERTFIRLDKNEPVKFSWEPVSDDYSIHLETGAKREALKTVAPPVGGKAGALSVNMKPGSQFWRLVAVSKKDPKQVFATMVSKITVVADVPPKLISPSSDQVVTMTGDDNIDLRWTNPSHLVDLKLHIFKNKFGGQTFIDLPLADTGVFTLKKAGVNEKYDALTDGDYFWQITGSHASGSAAVATEMSSDVYKFSVRSHLDLISPELQVPQANARLPFEAVNVGGQFFTWAAVAGIDKYHIRVETEPGKTGEKPAVVLEKDLDESTQVRMPQLQPGRYIWTVVSVSAEGERSKVNNQRRFQVESLPKLQWADGSLQETYLYISQTPTMKPQWKSGLQSGYSLYKVKVAGDDDFEKTVETKDLNTVIDVPKDGLYKVTVEAYDDSGKSIMARSAVREIDVQQRPLLPAPQYSERMPASLQAGKDGSAAIQWNAVQGAKGYALTLKDAAGKVVKTEKYAAVTNVKIDRLLPGQYKFSVSSIDAFNRAGLPGEEKSLVVPNVSDARPPVFKKFKIQ